MKKVILLIGLILLTVGVTAVQIPPVSSWNKPIAENPTPTKSIWEDYNTSAFQAKWMAENSDIAKQLTEDQAIKLIIFRESNAERIKYGSEIDKAKAQLAVAAIDGVFAANLDGSSRASDLMNLSTDILLELAPEHCGIESAIQVLRENYECTSHGLNHTCALGTMCWDDVNNLYMQGKYEEAIQALDGAIKQNPNDAMIWHDKGIALKALGKTEEADKAFAKAEELGYRVWLPPSQDN